jgi:hypothetical protein
MRVGLPTAVQLLEKDMELLKVSPWHKFLIDIDGISILVRYVAGFVLAIFLLWHTVVYVGMDVLRVLWGSDRPIALPTWMSFGRWSLIVVVGCIVLESAAKYGGYWREHKMIDRHHLGRLVPSKPWLFFPLASAATMFALSGKLLPLASYLGLLALCFAWLIIRDVMHIMEGGAGLDLDE